MVEILYDHLGKNQSDSQKFLLISRQRLFISFKLNSVKSPGPTVTHGGRFGTVVLNSLRFPVRVPSLHFAMGPVVPLCGCLLPSRTDIRD